MKRATVAQQLKRYRGKRNFVKTPEPAGHPGGHLRPADGPIYVVQKHAATRLHYDFRLELDGTLKSWAVPKGPSLDPSQKRLAVHVEDHPMEYAEFEGVIPPKQYGAGTVLIWDRGVWRPQGNPHDGYRQGVLKFRLEGHKLHGGWTLVRMQSRRQEAGDDGKENWLLIKERDGEAKKGKAGEIVERLTESVESGREIKDVATAGARVWHSNRKQESSGLRVSSSELAQSDSARRSNRRVQSDASKPQTRNSELSRVPGAVKARQPDWIEPQLATLVDRMPADDNWLHEIKFDGYRLLCRVKNGDVRLFTRNANDWTAKLSAQAQAVARLGVTDAWLDGEAVVLTEQGRSSFQALQNAFDSRFTGTIVYCVFDLMYLNGYDLRASPLIERKRLLASLCQRANDAQLRYSDHIVGDNDASFEEACRQGLEGLIVKRIDGGYRSGRGRGWLKVKCEQRQEFVIGGFTEPAGSRQGFGALLVGFYEDGRLRYAGKVGTGFSESLLKTLYASLVSLERTSPPFVNPPRGSDAKGAHWVAPKLVAEIRFSEWTQEGILRQPSFQGLRTDKPASAIGRERAQHLERTIKDDRDPKTKPTPRKTRKTEWLTNPDRVLYPDIGLTKSALAAYYEQVADSMLPHLRGRPLTLLRCPEGYQKCFYQKHVNEHVPSAIGRIEIEEDDGRDTYMLAESAEALLGLVQMGVLEIHTWGATKDRLERPDRLTFDLDPDPSVPWAQVVEAAQLTKTLLEELGLVSFLKTTGGKGLHIVTPIQRTHEWEEAKTFAKAVADHLVRAIPQRFTSNMAKRARKGKIFIDYLRNARGATAIAAYSTRAKPGAPVSAPLAWDELSEDLPSDYFTVMNLPARLKRLRRDPWDAYDRSARRLTADMSARLKAR
ncbi:MAG TPA: DNA ligase D [Nitrospira sp.]|nr:DNA ligase D [Nitrospira sp.]